MTTNTHNTASDQTSLHVLPIHILHVASGDLWAGAEVMLYTLAKALNNKPDTRVSAVILNHGELEQKLRDCGITVYILDESMLNTIQIFRQLNKIIGELNPDVIHTHRNKENFLGSLAAIFRHHKPSLRTVHGAPEHRPPLFQLAKHLIRFMNWFSGRFFQQAIVAVSPELAEKLKHSFPEAKIKVIENGIDVNAISHDLKRAPPRTNTDGNYRIGIAGRLVPVKRLDLFINTAVYLKRQQPELDINFYIYGDGPLLTTLQSQTQTLQAQDYIHFEGHCENIALALQNLDALLMTSDHEGLPMILLEAMYTQTPVIAHAVGGIPHLFEQGKCGTLITNHTAEAFAHAIMTLIQQPEEHQRLTERAFERIKQNYSAEQTATAYLELYKEIIQR